ncbi:MAG: hypothetical protein HKN23_21275, partial [Verrucomicrobiales bacterium]|nr:hypothetical protein [Verrucomicrobiales bacterium]
EYDVSLDFAVAVTPEAEWKSFNFTVASGAVAPMTLGGIEEDAEFRHGTSVVPQFSGGEWKGFVPATGHATVSWKSARKVGEGKLFFSTTAKIETTVGAGLMRQNHQIDYKVLQGELEELTIDLAGPGEVLEVTGKHIVGWEIAGEGDERTLTVKLSQAITEAGQVLVRTQTPLDAFPVRVQGLRLTPSGAVRHSGYIRLSNQGSVRLEPAGLEGLTQLAPDQFPGEPISARQVFVYRFPSAEYDFEVAADRIQPEVNVFELTTYHLTETDRMISARIEIDVREAPIREWELRFPEDYSVVSVTGGIVADYVVGTESQDGTTLLKVIFTQDVTGRQLINLQFEKNETAVAGDWELPPLEYPDAKSVRGDIGVVGAPGFRVGVSATDLLVEKPLATFPNPVPNLQQAFRIREPGWSATMAVELLEKSIQADAFHLYSLSEGTAYGSVLLNYFVTGAPVSEWQFTVPDEIENVNVIGMNVAPFRRADGTLTVPLHQPVIGPYTLLITFEEKVATPEGALTVGRVTPLDVQGERGFLQVVSPQQVQAEATDVSEGLLQLDALELPAEFRLLSSAPSLGTWQYTERPFLLNMDVSWFEPGTTVAQVVEYSQALSRVSPDGELVTELLYYVKSRNQRALKLELPEDARLWSVSVGGQSATARQTADATLIPLPGGIDPNIPVRVHLRLGRPAVDGTNPDLKLPVVAAPILKTDWKIGSDSKHLLVPTGGTVSPPQPVLRPTGFSWVANFGLDSLAVIAVLVLIGTWMSARQNAWLRLIGIVVLIAATIISFNTVNHANRYLGPPSPLEVSIPALASGESVELGVKTVPVWQANLSWFGIAILVAGIALTALGIFGKGGRNWKYVTVGGALAALGILIQRDSANWFFAVLGVIIILLLLLPAVWRGLKDLNNGWDEMAKRRASRKKAAEAAAAASAGTGENPKPGPGGTATASILIGGLLAFCTTGAPVHAQGIIPEGFSAADAIEQNWEISDESKLLTAKGTLKISGVPGERFLLLIAPAILTEFEGEGLRLTKQDVPGCGLSYIVSIPAPDGAEPVPDPANLDPFAEVTNPPATSEPEKQDFTATFEYQADMKNPAGGIALPTGPAAVQKIDATYDKAGWEFSASTAVKTEQGVAGGASSSAKILLAPHQRANIVLKPRARDVTMENTQFYVEAANLYLPGPGVIDGKHRLHIRPSQGQISELSVQVPDGLTVSEVAGPIGAWQFDAETRLLKLTVEPAQSAVFSLDINTQRSLDPLPTDASLAPLMVDGPDGQVGLVALAFGSDAQPETVESQTMSVVNLGDFDASLVPNEQTVLHRVFRYGTDGGDLDVRVAPVAPEVRVTANTVISLGDERVVLGINFTTEITRAGLFQLSFPLPEGLEVDSLSGDALHHWAELTEDGQRQIILHLKSKTTGTHNFALSLTGQAPDGTEDWEVPRFEINEATRQTGDLVIQPDAGLQLEAISRQNASEVDPRALGGNNRGALAFRLNRKDWTLTLGIEKLDPWVTGQVLHEVTLREGQTRTAIIGNFRVQNASIRSLQVQLPVSEEDEIKTLRASGKSVADLVRTAADSDTWEIQFKRRVIGDVQFRIEYERRGERADNIEALTPAVFPGVRPTYHFGVRAGGRLEIEAAELPAGWQATDWTTISQKLREAGNRTAPMLTLRVVAPENSLNLKVQRHSLADALKLGVDQGIFVSILSPLGDQLTAVELRMNVIQRSSLTVGLPPGGDLFSIFVNGESVRTVRQGDDWQFNILPGADDRTANVQFVYSVPGSRLKSMDIVSPQLNVPLENIRWQVVAPRGYELTSEDGNLQLIKHDIRPLSPFGHDQYVNEVQGRRAAKEKQASQLLDYANQLLQAGEQGKARWALNSVANQYALDAASNEDARVQLENLQTQQAMVGVNTRRQRLYLDHSSVGEGAVPQNDQLKQGAAANPVLQEGELNFRPQELSQLLQGNTSDDNAVLQKIAAQLVRHQRSTEPAPQAINLTLPREGTVYNFVRPVQVAENAPLQLELKFSRESRVEWWRAVLGMLLLALLIGGTWFLRSRKATP